MTLDVESHTKNFISDGQIPDPDSFLQPAGLKVTVSFSKCLVLRCTKKDLGFQNNEPKMATNCKILKI